MLSISDFSEMCDLPPQTLRYYHAEGLLVPADVDEWTGYRSYTFGQVERAMLINVLRGTGMIAAVREGGGTAAPDPGRGHERRTRVARVASRSGPAPRGRDDRGAEAGAGPARRAPPLRLEYGRRGGHCHCSGCGEHRGVARSRGGRHVLANPGHRNPGAEEVETFESRDELSITRMSIPVPAPTPPAALRASWWTT
ncbi:MerR family transcriptional regulator [Streptomyces sp. NPDC050732]|uniref:MerR family transcriptional regulator n=1 Tax=Streptomyces sp. NPDC050732 TaxID=3154632 RepID=UPI003430876A